MSEPITDVEVIGDISYEISELNIGNGEIPKVDIDRINSNAKGKSGQSKPPFLETNGSMTFDRGTQTGTVENYVEKIGKIKSFAEDVKYDTAKEAIESLAEDIATKGYGFEGKVKDNFKGQVIKELDNKLLNPIEDSKAAKPADAVTRANEIVGPIPSADQFPEKSPANTEDVKQGFKNPAIEKFIRALDPTGDLQTKIDKIINDGNLDEEGKKAAYEDLVDKLKNDAKEKATTEDKRSRLEWIGDKLKSSWDIISVLGKLGAVIFLIVFSVGFINSYRKERSGCFVDIIDPKTNSVKKTYKIVGLSCGDYRKSGKYYQDYGNQYQKECIQAGSGPTPVPIPPKNPSGCGSCDQEITKSDGNCPCPFKDSQVEDPYASTFCDDSFLVSSDPTFPHHYFKRYCTFEDGVADLVVLMADLIGDIADSGGAIGDFIRTILNLVKYGAIIAVVFVIIYALFFILQRFNFIGGGGGKGDGTPVVVQIDERGKTNPQQVAEQQPSVTPQPSVKASGPSSVDQQLSEEEIIDKAIGLNDLSTEAGIPDRVGEKKRTRQQQEAVEQARQMAAQQSRQMAAQQAAVEQQAQQSRQAEQTRQAAVEKQSAVAEQSRLAALAEQTRQAAVLAEQTRQAAVAKQSAVAEKSRLAAGQQAEERDQKEAASQKTMQKISDEQAAEALQYAEENTPNGAASSSSTGQNISTPISTPGKAEVTQDRSMSSNDAVMAGKTGQTLLRADSPRMLQRLDGERAENMEGYDMANLFQRPKGVPSSSNFRPRSSSKAKHNRK